MNLGPQMADISVNNQIANFNTEPHGDPLKIKISKIGLRHVLRWPKLGLEPTFHDPGTFGGFGKPEHTHTNRQDSCFIIIDRSIDTCFFHCKHCLE